jgi:integrase
MWLADREQDGFANSVYRANWVALAPAFANRRPELISVDDCRAYARHRFEAGRSSWTVHTELSRLRACLHWARQRKHLATEVYVWVPSAGQSRDRVLGVDEIHRLLSGAMAGDPHIMLFVVLAITTGARHAAILDLTWDRIDWVAGTIQYDENLPPDPMSKSWRKGRATVPMNAMSRQALELAFRGRQTEFVIEHGGRRLLSVREGFANAVRRAGISGRVTPHTLRHTIATMTNDAGIDIRQVAGLLGHRDSRTTDAVYTHNDPQRFLGRAVAVIDAELGEVAALPALDRNSASAGAQPKNKPPKVSQRDKQAGRSRYRT